METPHPHIVLLAVDGSESALRAARYGLGLTSRLGARVHIVSVVEYATQGMVASAGMSAWAVTLPAARQAADAAVDRAMNEAAASKVAATTEVVDASDAAAGVLRAAENARADLIILGSHGRTGVARVFLGSVAEKVVRMSKVPVLVVH